MVLNKYSTQSISCPTTTPECTDFAGSSLLNESVGSRSFVISTYVIDVGVQAGV